MTFKITATAPTSYQLSSLKHFGMGFNENGNGSFSASKEFDTEEEAKEFLRGRAEMYNSEDPSGSDKKIADMNDSIDKFGTLTLDAVTAHIEEC
jgi:hypothetical protein